MLRSALVFFLVSAGALRADPCDDLWFSESAILAQGGYCVASPLGVSVFGEAECSQDAPEFPEFLSGQMEAIKAAQQEMECAVDEAGSSLDLWQLETRLELLIQPVHGDVKNHCVMKAPTSLRTAPSPEADVIGWLERGDLVRMEHIAAGGADFASRVKRGTIVVDDIGWFSSSQCKPL